MRKLPLQIGQEIFVKPQHERTPHKAKSKVIGAKHGQFIIIEEPIIKISESLSIIIGTAVVCWLFHEGEVYKFETTIRQEIFNDLVILDYPSNFFVEKLRRYTRISVNLEAAFKVGFKENIYKGTIVDISEGGCRIHGDSIIFVSIKESLRITFILPNNEHIEEMEAVVKSVEHDRKVMKTNIGVQFQGPDKELSKIRAFCQFCEYFKVH